MAFQLPGQKCSLITSRPAERTTLVLVPPTGSMQTAGTEAILGEI